MIKLQIHKMKNAVVACLTFLAVAVPLGVVGVATPPRLPAEENVGQWIGLGKALMLSGICISVAVLLLLCEKDTRRRALSFPCFYVCVSWGLLLCGALEAIWGIHQLYGFSLSGHSRYAFTGSFFNPGPYAGYLAMVLPLCLHLYLSKADKKTIINTIERGAVAIIGILILCVLPASMSRSAWLAATVGCGLVAYQHCDKRKWRLLWARYKKRYMAWGAGLLFIVILAGTGAFMLKPDSALGRLFMWKITCRAIASHPWGCDKGFVFAYGEAQEEYFAQKDYAEWEERVAGSPEYVFNEYLSLALTKGIVMLLAALAVVFICLRMGLKRGRYGICGALLSLLVFSFSSYPMHFPAFVVACIFLLLACGAGDVAGKSVILCAALILWAGGYMEMWQQEEQACLYTADPMVLNVMGKNYQELHSYTQAETCFRRAIHRLPGRIYPYYLLANLYAEPDYYHPDKLKEVANIVLTKEPKVHSTAIKEMRVKVRELIGKINNEIIKTN